jgi:hypothetical protein
MDSIDNFKDFLNKNDRQLDEARMLVQIEKIAASMVYSQFGPKTSSRMRDELTQAVRSAIAPVLTKYDYTF